MTKKEKAGIFLAHLKERFPNVSCALRYESPFELLVATILSAQCTDIRVNIVTEELFKTHRTPQDFVNITLDELMEKIRSTGFFRNKAKNIKGMAEALLARHGGEVPADLDELVKLPGVGRKTGNVVLSEVFHQPGIVVDTHVKRIVNRLGLEAGDDPVKIEFALMKLLPKDEWAAFSHRAIWFGRETCDARKPKCGECAVSGVCAYYQKKVK